VRGRAPRASLTPLGDAARARLMLHAAIVSHP